MTVHNSSTGSDTSTTPSVKSGDKIRILLTDAITFQLYPELIGLEVDVVSVDSEGDPKFVYEKGVPSDWPYERKSNKYLNVSAADGWEYTIVK